MLSFSRGGPRQKIINQELGGKKPIVFISHPEEINSVQNRGGICLNTDRHTLIALNAALRGLTANSFPVHLARDRSLNSFHLTSCRNPI